MNMRGEFPLACHPDPEISLCARGYRRSRRGERVDGCAMQGRCRGSGRPYDWD